MLRLLKIILSHSLSHFFLSYVILLSYFIIPLSGCSTTSLNREGQPRHLTLNNKWTYAPQSEALVLFRQLNLSSPILVKIDSNTNNNEGSPLNSDSSSELIKGSKSGIRGFFSSLFKKTVPKELLISGNPYTGISALNPKTGKSIWNYNFKYGTEVKLTEVAGYLFAAANDGFIYCLNTQTGSLIWSFPTRTENLSELYVNQGIVYVITSNNTLYALEALSGKQIWIYARPDASLFSVRMGSRPIVYQNKLYTAFSDGSLMAFQAKTGLVEWEKSFISTKKFKDLDSNIIINNNTLFFSSFDNKTYALDLTTNELKWSFEGGGAIGDFLILGSFICFSTSESGVKCLDQDTGMVKWEYTLKKGIASSPVSLNGLLVFGETQGPLRVINVNTQTEVAHFYSGRGISATSLAVSEGSDKGMIYFVSNESYIYAMEAKWGYQKDRF